jgi:2-aminoadipate transaminase
MPPATSTTRTLLSTRMTNMRPSPIRELLRLVDQPDVLSLAGGLPALDARDAERVRSVMDRVLALTGPLGPVALQYGPTEGVDRLREQLAARTGNDPSDVLVTTGSQQGLDLLARALLDPWDVAVVQTPSYLGALQSFANVGARVESVGSDGDGLDVDALATRLGAGLRPTLVYVVPNFHNPTGAVLTVERRRALLTLADRYGFCVIEDDPYAELRFAGAPLPALADLGAPVIRLGSASKILAPGLRVGWMDGPAEILEAVAVLKQSADLHTSCLSQLVVAELLADEDGQRAHVEAIRARYRERAGALLDALDRSFGDRLDVLPVRGGMFAWATARDATDTAELLPVALGLGVAYVPGAAFSVEGDGWRHSMRLSFATNHVADIERAVERLAAAWATAS